MQWSKARSAVASSTAAVPLLLLALTLLVCAIKSPSANAVGIASSVAPPLQQNFAAPLGTHLDQGKGAAVVSGVVTGHGGEPLLGVPVLLVGTSGEASASTNSAGFYSLRVPEGTYRLRTGGAVYSLPEERHGGSGAEISSLTVSGNVTEDLEFAKLPVGMVRVRVLDADGDPVPHVSIRGDALQEETYTFANAEGSAVTYNGAGTAGCPEGTDNNGECTIYGYEGAPLRLEAIREGEVTGTASAEATAAGSDATINLLRTVVVSGVVTGHGGEPLLGVPVLLVGTSGEASASTNSAGFYSLRVPEGTYRLRTGGAVYSLPEERHGGSGAEISSLTVSGNVTEDLEFAKLPVGMVRVRVLDADGDPVPHVSIRGDALQEETYTFANAEGSAVTYNGAGTAGCPEGTDNNGECTIYGYEGAPLRLEAIREGEVTGTASAVVESGGATALLHLPLAVVQSAGAATGLVEVEAPLGSTVRNASATAISDDTAPGSGRALVGSLGYEVAGIRPGTAITVRLRLPVGSTPTEVYKLLGGEYVNVGSIATISGRTIALRLTDGGVGDTDGEANGVIVDPVVPVGVTIAGPPPTVSKLAPKKGPATGGTRVTLTGTNLTHPTAVTFGVVEATDLKVLSAKSISVLAPANSAGPASVTVTTPGGTSTPTTKSVFKYAAPAVTSLTPSVGSTAGGQRITITGAGFTPGAGATTVLVGKTPATNVTCGSTIECIATMPAASKPGTVDIVVSAGDLKSKRNSGDRFTYN